MYVDQTIRGNNCLEVGKFEMEEEVERASQTAEYRERGKSKKWDDDCGELRSALCYWGEERDGK